MRSVLALSLLLPGAPSAAQLRAAPPRLAPVRIPATSVAPMPLLAPSYELLERPSLLPNLRPSIMPHVMSAPALAPGPLTPAAAAEDLAARLRGTEIILIQAPQDEKGRRRGYDLGKSIEELMKRREGQVRGLQRDGPAEIFADTFAIEVQPGAKDEVLAELRAIEGADVRSLDELIALGSRRVVTTELPDAETLKGYAAQLKEGTLASRFSAFAALASLLEDASPEALAAIPAETRDALVIPLYGIAGDAVNAYNMVEGSTRQDLRGRLAEARSADEGWAGVEKGAAEGVKHPALQARYMPLRAQLTRALSALDRLDTPESRDVLLRVLPHAGYAGLELTAAPGRASRYVSAWLSRIRESVEETRQGLLAPAPAEGEKSDWHGSSRSGGYTHVDGRRQSNHLYQWRPYRFDPAEGGHETLLMLGLPRSGAAIVEPLLALLRDFEVGWPELQELHKRKTLAREYANAERTVEYYKKQYLAQQGITLSEEQVAQIRRQLLEDAEQRFERSDRMDGHSVIDRVLLSFGYHDYWTGSIPGFDAAAYAANVLAFYSGAAATLSDKTLVMQLADGALHFLTSLAASDLIAQRPELRAQAISVWRALDAKARSLGITLNTRLDGVIDPRPEKRLESQPLEQTPGDATVWQLAPSPDGRYIAQATGDRRVRVWDESTRALVTTIELDDARQLYGDLANSLGVSWDGPRLRVTTLHDGEKDGKKVSYNLIRTYDLRTQKAVRTPIDAAREDIARGVYVLKENATGRGGAFYASPMELRNEQNHYLGAEVRLIAADGRDLAKIENANLLDLQGSRLLASAPGRSAPALRVYDVTDPSAPRDATPAWLTAQVAEWKARNPVSEYGWWPSISAKLGSFLGRPALLWADEGRLNIYDLDTGELLRSLEIPSGWTIKPYLTNPDGTGLAAVVTAPGQFSGPNPERIVAWDLLTGKLVMDHDATFVPTGWLYMRGQSISELQFSADGRRLIAAGRKGVQLFELH